MTLKHLKNVHISDLVDALINCLVNGKGLSAPENSLSQIKIFKFQLVFIIKYQYIKNNLILSKSYALLFSDLDEKKEAHAPWKTDSDVFKQDGETSDAVKEEKPFWGLLPIEFSSVF